MENILSLNEEIDTIMEKKLSVCDCNPCTCSEKKKNIYFQELTDILATFNNISATFNEEYSGANLRRISGNSY
jgi:hypothetical protein